MTNTPVLRRKGFMQRWKGPSRKARGPKWVAEPDRYMPATTRTRWPSGFTMTYVTGLNYQASKLFFGTADYPTRNFLIPFVGFALTEGGLAPQETVLPNGDILLDGARFIDHNGIKYPIDFLGMTSAVVTASTGVVHGMVTLPYDVPGRSIIGVETFYHGTVGGTYIGGYRIQKHRGEKYWGGADYATVLALADADAANTPALDVFYNTVGNATNSQPLAYGPALILAQGYDGRPVPLMLADSLVERQEIAASADERGNMGVWRRWFDTPDPTWGSYIPLIMGVPGAKSAQELATSALKRWDMIDGIAALYNGGRPIWTVVADQSGRNDNQAVAATWYNFKFGLITRMKTRYGDAIKVVGMTLWPTVTSTNAGRTRAAWAVSTLWNGITGTLKTVNDAVLASPLYSATMDVFPAYCMDDTPSLPPASEDFPLGNLVGHPGNQDGVTTWNTIVAPDGIPRGAVIRIEYQPGVYTGRTIIDIAPNGNGTSTYTVQEVFATNVQDNAPIMGSSINLDSGSGTTTHVHPLLYAILRIVSRIPQAWKQKFNV